MLTASQKDGVVRIWSWGTEISKQKDGTIRIEQVRQIFLRMVPPPQCHDTTTAAEPSSRRRLASSSNSKQQVNCDMATWTSDDSKIITSQCCLLTATGSDIVPGSQIVHVWDSRTGQCILGLPSIHNKPCPVLISHPIDASIMVSAGSDGFVHVWNLNSGKCLFSHENIHQYGSIELASDRGIHCGYLDGSFSPDGMNLVLTDDKGRITIIDTYQSEDCTRENDEFSTSLASTEVRQNNTEQSVAPFWMQEQYLANDYYELFYDTNGYCIERGSRQPPHLAPEAARCNHIGSAFGPTLQDSLSTIPGPIPLSEEEVRVNRDEIRQQSFEIRKPEGILAQNVRGKRPLIEAYPSATSNVVNNGSIHSKPADPLPNPNLAQPQGNRSATRQPSNRYRWIDYDDAVREDDDIDEIESDYEENNNAAILDDDESDGSPRQRRRNNNENSARARRRNNRDEARHEVERVEEDLHNEPSRISARQSTRRANTQHYEDSDSDIDYQLLSTNKTPSGEFIHDYMDLGHLYKLPSGGSLSRSWVSRNQCVKGYIGLKTFLPQVGDNIVYIPTAHSSTLEEFPICNNSTTGAPWKSWPRNSHWPVVQCEIKNIRYRFPYNGHFGNKTE